MIILFVLIIFLAYQAYFELNKNLETSETDALDLIDQRMQTVFLEINNFPGDASNDILFSSRLSCFNNLFNLESSDSMKEDIENNFIAFLKQSSAYYQIRYIDESGRVIVGADFDGINYKIINEKDLKEERFKDYFNQVIDLNREEVFISKLDLNIKNREIENRGTKDKPKYVPVIRYATPVFNKQGDSRGVIISNIYADYFLEDIRRSQREGELTFLINNEGYYLAHPDKTKEFSFMFNDKKDNFKNDYIINSENILTDCSKRRTENNNLIFTYRCIYPRAGSFEIHEGSKKLLEGNNGDYHWILVTVTDKKGIEKPLKDFKIKYIWIGLFYFVIILIITVLVGLIYSNNLTSTKSH